MSRGGMEISLCSILDRHIVIFASARSGERYALSLPHAVRRASDTEEKRVARFSQQVRGRQSLERLPVPLLLPRPGVSLSHTAVGTRWKRSDIGSDASVRAP